VKQRIGIIANTSWNILNFRMGLIHALKNAGHEVFIIAPQDKHTNEIIETGHEVTIVKGLARKGTNPLKDLLLVAELAGIYQKLKLNIVLQYTIKPNIYGSLAGVMTGVKTISTVTGLGYVFINNGASSTIAKLLYKLAFNFSDKIFFQNEDDRALFVNEKLVKSEKSEVIPGSGIDTDFYHPSYCIPLEPKEPKKGFTFLMIARLLKDKGVYEYMKAAENIKKAYPETIFLLLGDQDEGNPAGVSSEDIKVWKQENNVKLLGFDKNTRKYICKSDAVVLPSYREGIPKVILESFAMGKPCITTDAPGCRHTVDDNINGLICKVADAEDLERNILKFMKSPLEVRVSMGREARNKATNTFSTSIIVKKYLDLISKL